MSWMFVATEVFGYVLAALFFVQARRRQRLPILVTAFFYGLLTEYITVRTRTDYCYGEFMVMVPPMWWPVPSDWCPVGPRVPLWGSLTWGFLIYGAMTLSADLAMPTVVRSLFDGLLVMTIDWILDPLASWLKFWIWQSPGPWFGIPLDNFAGWFFMVFSFSLANRTLRVIVPRLASGWTEKIVVAVATIVVSIAMLTGELTVYVWLVNHGAVEAVLLVTILLAATAVVVRYALIHSGDSAPQWRIFGAAVATHVFYVTLIVTSRLSEKEPALLIVAAVTFALTVVGYSWPFRRRLFGGARPPRQRSEIQPL
jgi:uncharacterized membrane protein